MAIRHKIERWLKVAIFAGLLVLVLIIFSQKIEFTSVDLGRHLENGKIVWSNTGVLFENLYSYTEPSIQFINHHWLAGVIFYLVYLIGGFKLLSIFNILLISLAFILAFYLAKKKAGFYISAFVSIPVIFLLSERVEVRPETFSYLFIILVWYVVDRIETKNNKRLLIWLIPLFFLWANTHIYFFIGLILYAIKIAADFIPTFFATEGDIKKRLRESWLVTKTWFIHFAWIIIACLFNPNFIRGLLYPFNIFKNYGYEIAENKSIFYLQNLMINGNIPLAKALLFLLVLSFVSYLFYHKKFNLFNIISAVFFSLLALFAVRNLALFALVFLILFSENLKYPVDYLKSNIYYLQKDWRDKYRMFGALALLLIVLGLAVYLLNDAKTNNSVFRGSLGWGLAQGADDSIIYFKNNKLSGPIFNNYDLGSALIFWLYPQEKVFVDNRPEAYSAKFFSDIYRPMQLERDKWEKYSTQYDFKVIYFSHTDLTPWAQAFLSNTVSNNWRLVYFDRYTVIMLNIKNNNPNMVTNLELDNTAIRVRLRELAAESDLKGKLHLASLASIIHQPDLAAEIYQDLLFSNPDNALVLSLLGNIYAGSDDRMTMIKAKEYLQRGIDEGYNLPGNYNQIGLIDWRLGDYLSAERAWRQAVKLHRNNESALYYLNQVDKLRQQGELMFTEK